MSKAASVRKNRVEGRRRFACWCLLFGGIAVAAICVGRASGATVPFTSADGAFGFHYAAELVKCEAQDAKVTSESVWTPAEACRCNDPGGAAVTAVCFGYPKDKYKDKPTFNGASFFVATDVNAADAASCMAGSANWGEIKGENTTIGGGTFRHSSVSGAGRAEPTRAGDRRSGRLKRR